MVQCLTFLNISFLVNPKMALQFSSLEKGLKECGIEWHLPVVCGKYNDSQLIVNSKVHTYKNTSVKTYPNSK